MEDTMRYEEWLLFAEDELLIKFAETGADREMCFDLERCLWEEYEDYCNR